MTAVDYYEQYVELMSEKLRMDREILDLKKKLQDQAEELLSLHKLVKEKENRIQDLQSNQGNGNRAHKTTKALQTPKSSTVKPVVQEVYRELKDYGELIPWTVMFKRSHPGSLSHLRKQQRETIQQAIKEFLIAKIGTLESECYDKDGKICMPESFIEEFQTWLDVKIDEGILDSTPKRVSLPGNPTQRQSHAANTLKERAPAAEIAQNFIPGNELAQELVDIAEKEYADVVISLSKFTSLIESFCQDDHNRPLGVKVNKRSMRAKFEEVFSEDIEQWELKKGKKRKSSVGPLPAKRSKPEVEKGLLKDSPKPLDLSKPGEPVRYNMYFLLSRLLRDVYQDYNNETLENRVAMKRKVKQWLKQQLGDQFENCRRVIPSGDNANHQTYCVPRHLQVQFKEWAKKEMTTMGLI